MALLINGTPQKELANGVVKVPFGTEYELRFRNKNDRNAVVQIFIDGENVSGGGYVVRANSHIDIKRHSDKDRSFKFVSLDSEAAVDFGKNGPNEDKVKGTIEARFFFEKEVPKPVYVPYVWHHIHYNHNMPSWQSNKTTYRGEVPLGDSDETFGCTMDSCEISPQTGANKRGPLMRRKSHSPINSSVNPTISCSLGASSHQPVLKDGCTVEGVSTGQTFYTTSMDTETAYTSVKMFLQGYEENIQMIAEVASNALKRQPNAIELENEELRRKIAELENEKLKQKLSELTSDR